MGAQDRTAALLASSDDDRRFELLGDFVTADPEGASSEGQRLLGSSNPDERELGAQLLGQLAARRRPAVRDLSEALMRRLARESIADVTAAIVVALGHAEDERARDSVLALSDHTAPGVRYAVAVALPFLNLDDRGLDALRRLSRDVDDDVRDWATFGLAESDAQDVATIEALAARTEDLDDDTRAEAIFGLARRKDPRARALVERELRRRPADKLLQRARDELDA